MCEEVGHASRVGELCIHTQLTEIQLAQSGVGIRGVFSSETSLGLHAWTLSVATRVCSAERLS